MLKWNIPLRKVTDQAVKASQQAHNVKPTSIQRQDVESMLNRHRFNVVIAGLGAFPPFSTYICTLFRTKVRLFNETKFTVLDLITAHTHISAQSSNFKVVMIQPIFFFCMYFFIKAYVVGTHLNCLDKSRQFR